MALLHQTHDVLHPAHEVDARSPEPLIVVGVDGSKASDSALRWALSEAKLHGDTVEAVSVWPTSLLGDGLGPPPWEAVTAQSNSADEVEAALGRIGGAGDVPVTVRSLYGNPGVMLRRVATARVADLVVIGRTSERLGYEVLAGSVSRALRRSGTRPVVVVPPSWGGAGAGAASSGQVVGGVVGGKEVVVGIDGTRRARVALRWALTEAARRHARVRAVLAWDRSSRAHAVGALTVVAESSLAAQAKAEQMLAAEIEATLADLPDLSGLPDLPDLSGLPHLSGLSGVEVVPVAAHAAAHVALLRESAGADLLVLGDHRRLELDELLLGSTTRVCLRHAAPPVVLVPDLS